MVTSAGANEVSGGTASQSADASLGSSAAASAVHGAKSKASSTDSFIAAFDIGSSAVKAVLVSRDGRLSFERTVAYPAQAAVHASGEQDPEVWWQAFVEVLSGWWAQGVEPRSIAALGFSGQMQCMAPIDEAGLPVRAAVLHADARAQTQADALVALVGEAEIYRVTRNPFNAASVWPKLRWLVEHEPEAAARTRHVLVGAKDLLIGRLTGRWVTDATTAATTGLFDIERGDWALDWMERSGLPRDWLPEIVASDEAAGVVSAAATSETGLWTGCPVVTGLGDAAATTLGAGVVDAGQSYAYLGTSGWVARVSADFNPPGAPLFVLPYLDANRRIRIGPISNAGNVHRWALGLMDGQGDAATVGDEQAMQRPGDADATPSVRVAASIDTPAAFAAFAAFAAYAAYAAFDASIAATASDPNLLFLPYLGGERFPVTTSGGTGTYYGLSASTSRPQMMRAALEGVSLSLRWALDTLDERPPETLVAVGGGTRSAAWMQILADSFAATVVVPPRADLLPCLGAAAMAANCLGWTSDAAAFIRHAAAGTTAAAGSAAVEGTGAGVTDGTKPGIDGAPTVYDPDADGLRAMRLKSLAFRRLHHALEHFAPNDASGDHSSPAPAPKDSP
ncbi:MAG: xylulose kinase [Rhizobacter sp.]|nr:xylulose kinase [Rhizobacter sp.]